MNRPRNTILLLFTMLALAAGCTTDPDDKDAPLQTRTLAEATQQTQTDAKIITEAAGAELSNWTTNPTPCSGPDGEFADDDRWYLNAGGNLTIAPTDQLPTLQRIKTALQTQGWEITDDSVFADNTRGNLDARNPTTGYTASLNTTMDLNHLAVSLSSPCAMPAPGENPLQG